MLSAVSRYMVLHGESAPAVIPDTQMEKFKFMLDYSEEAVNMSNAPLSLSLIHILDYTDRATCPIFGDGGGAVMLEATTENVGIMDAVLRTDGKGLPFLHIKAGGSVCPPSYYKMCIRDRNISDTEIRSDNCIK